MQRKCETLDFLAGYYTMNYQKKNRFQSVRITALCLYNLQRENLVFKKSLSRKGVKNTILDEKIKSMKKIFLHIDIDIFTIV